MNDSYFMKQKLSFKSKHVSVLKVLQGILNLPETKYFPDSQEESKS